MKFRRASALNLFNHWRAAAFVPLAMLLAAAGGDTVPQVVLATPGTSDATSGNVTRYTLRFSEDMVPLGDPRAPAPAKSDCPVPSEGRWVDTRTFVIEFARALPGGIACAVDLKAGLATLRGVDVAGTRSFPIDTGGPSVRTVITGGSYEGIEEDTIFLIATNVAADRASVARYGYCAVDGIGEKIALDVLPQDKAVEILDGLGASNWTRINFLDEAGLPARFPEAGADRDAALARMMAVKCRRPLPPGREMALVWDARIEQLGAKSRTAGRDQRFDFDVRPAFSARFECSRVNPQAGCNPIRDVNVRLTSEVPRAQAAAARLRFADGSERAPAFASDDTSATVSRLTFEGPFPEARDATVILPADLTDESGRPLQNAARFPLAVRFDAAPPLVKFAAPFGILEASEGGVLPVTVRAVEPALKQKTSGVSGEQMRVDASDGDIAAWLRKIDDADDTDLRAIPDGKGGERTVNYTGTKPLLRPGTGNDIDLPLPGKGKDFEVVGIPLKAPGFYV
ncbi:MAG: hypothetical protein RLZZ58_1190, partial [Pseudomonadota bacterium]